jgi:hypothetical protein
MVGLLVVGFVANVLMRPVSERHHEPADDDVYPQPEGHQAAVTTGGNR